MNLLGEPLRFAQGTARVNGTRFAVSTLRALIFPHYRSAFAPRSAAVRSVTLRVPALDFLFPCM